MPAGILPIKPAQICAALGVGLGPAGVLVAVAVRVRASVAVTLGFGVLVTVPVGGGVGVSVGRRVAVNVALGATVAVGVGALAHAPSRIARQNRTSSRIFLIFQNHSPHYRTIQLLQYRTHQLPADISTAHDNSDSARVRGNSILQNGGDGHRAGRLDDDFHSRQRETERVENFGVAHQNDVAQQCAHDWKRQRAN